MSNLTLINTSLLGLILVIFAIIVRRHQKFLIRHIVISFGLIFIPLLGAIITGVIYNKMGLLYYGEGDSYWDVTVHSFFQRFTLIENLKYFVFPVILPLIFGCLFLFISSVYKKKWDSFYDAAIVMAFFFFGNLVVSILQTSFLNVNYPEDRTALFFFPFLVGMVSFYADKIPKGCWMMMPFLYLPFQFICMINLSYNSFWKNERMTDEFFQVVLREFQEKGEQPVVGGYVIRQVVWDYYNYKNGGKLGRLHCDGYENDTISDFIIGMENENRFRNYLYTKLLTDPYSKLSLYERNDKLVPLKVQDPQFEVCVENDIRNFIDFGDYTATDLSCNYIQSRWELRYKPELFVSDVWLVLQGVDMNGHQTFLQYSSLERLRPNFDDMVISQKLVSPLIPEGTTKVKAYVRNLNNDPISIFGGKVSFYIY